MSYFHRNFTFEELPRVRFSTGAEKEQKKQANSNRKEN
jgi:hypothetical protein